MEGTYELPVNTLGALKWSPDIAALVTALSAAQGEIRGAAKDSVNPHLKSKYADLANIWDACRTQLSKNGIAVIQSPAADGPRVTVSTLLAHKSGQWVTGDLHMVAQQSTPQGIGSAITYARRYALAAMVGVAPDDDDGNAASGTTPKGKREAEDPPPGFADGIDTGGNPVGTKEAAAYVAQRKIAAKKAEQAEKVPDILKDIWGAMVDIPTTCAVFKQLKEQMSEAGGEAGIAKYYTILQNRGVKHANEFKSMSRDDARSAAKECFEYLQSAVQEAHA